MTPDDLHAAMTRLADRRPVFHSEADFQHALARQLMRDRAHESPSGWSGLRGCRTEHGSRSTYGPRTRIGAPTPSWSSSTPPTHLTRPLKTSGTTYWAPAATTLAGMISGGTSVDVSGWCPVTWTGPLLFSSRTVPGTGARRVARTGSTKTSDYQMGRRWQVPSGGRIMRPKARRLVGSLRFGWPGCMRSHGTTTRRWTVMGQPGPGTPRCGRSRVNRRLARPTRGSSRGTTTCFGARRVW